MEPSSAQPTVQRYCDDHWEWFLTTKQPPYEITGKYLFFSHDRDLLLGIAIQELQSGMFHLAKIPIDGKNRTEDYVLCLYYKDDSRKSNLATKYGPASGVKYRYWKTDAATAHGEYSREFLESLSPEDRDQFESRRP